MKKSILSIIVFTAISFGAIAQNVNIPDINFKAYLVGNNQINTNEDAEIQASEAVAYDGTINCQNLNISDLTGIESFINLESLLCGNNPLNTIDVSQNTALLTFQPHNNNLTTLDISQNTALNNFVCLNNNLTTLDFSQNPNLSLLVVSENNLASINVSQNPHLFIFSCIDNELTSLDLSQNTNLEQLYCYNNNLESLDVSNSTLLSSFDCSNNDLTALKMSNNSPDTLTTFVATSNPNLTCIEVNDVATATSVWTDIDAGVSFSSNCQEELVTSIAVQGEVGATVITNSGGTLQMEANVIPMDATDNTYVWSVVDGTGSASINLTGLLTAIADGTVTVTATANDASGVTGSTIITISNQSGVGIHEQETLPSLSIFPNPVSSQLTIDFDDEINAITIIDVTGKAVKTFFLSNKTIDVSDLGKGYYVIQIQSKNGLLRKRFNKQ